MGQNKARYGHAHLSKRLHNYSMLCGDDYLEGLKDLGVTLPDGGERIDEMDEESER